MTFGRRLAQLSVPPMQDFGWTYNDVGNVTAITDNLNTGRSQTFGYDALSRLTGASGAYGSRT